MNRYHCVWKQLSVSFKAVFAAYRLTTVIQLPPQYQQYKTWQHDGLRSSPQQSCASAVACFKPWFTLMLQDISESFIYMFPNKAAQIIWRDSCLGLFHASSGVPHCYNYSVKHLYSHTLYSKCFFITSSLYDPLTNSTTR